MTYIFLDQDSGSQHLWNWFSMHETILPIWYWDTLIDSDMKKREHSTLPGVLCQAHDSKTCLFDGTEIVSLWCCCSCSPLCRIAGSPERSGTWGTGPVTHQIMNIKLTLFQSGGGSHCVFKWILRGHLKPTQQYESCLKSFL